jgi:hypothetical protein
MILSLLPRLARHARHVRWAGLLAASVVACSSNNTPPADAFIAASVGTGSNGTACPLGGIADNWIDVGTATASKPTTVQDGGNNGGGNVAVACSVTADGNGFDI